MVAGAGLEPATFGLWARRATNCSTPRHLVGGIGFEPMKAKPADLQSAPFNHSGIRPHGASNRTRTYDLLITNQLLYQLSYASTFSDKSNYTHRSWYCQAYGTSDSYYLCLPIISFLSLYCPPVLFFSTDKIYFFRYISVQYFFCPFQKFGAGN